MFSPGDGRYGSNDDSEAGGFESQGFCWKRQETVLAHSFLRVGLSDLPLTVSGRELRPTAEGPSHLKQLSVKIWIPREVAPWEAH